jgi:hypothetical protein
MGEKFMGRSKKHAETIRAVVVALGVSAVLAMSMAARGSFVIMDSSNAWNGTSPTGPTPWLQAAFSDSSTPGVVNLTLRAKNLSDNSGNLEDVQDWFFNLDPALTPSDLLFNFGTKTGTFTTPAILATTDDAQKTQGNVPFDIDVSFATGNPSNRLTQGDSITYSITYGGAGTFNADSFAFTTSRGSFGPFYDSAHIQNTGSNGQGSGDIAATTTVPEPASAAIAAAAASVLLMHRPRRRPRPIEM